VEAKLQTCVEASITTRSIKEENATFEPICLSYPELDDYGKLYQVPLVRRRAEWTCRLISYVQPTDRAVQEAHDCRSFLEQTDCLLVDAELNYLDLRKRMRWPHIRASGSLLSTRGQTFRNVRSCPRSVPETASCTIEAPKR
jgi:hypothetical protein